METACRCLRRLLFGGTVGFTPELSGQTIALASAEVTVTKPVTINGAGAPGVIISGSGMLRPFVINAGVNAAIRSLKIMNGYSYQLAGGILNNGNLTLEHVIVTQNTVTTDKEDWWKGGAGIYNGDGSLLVLADSTVSNNNAQAALFLYINLDDLLRTQCVS